jgi:hypothetical protein
MVLVIRMRKAVQHDGPNDITRCTGRIGSRLIGQAGSVRVTSNVGHVECLRCARREPAPIDATVLTIDPPPFINGECPQRLVRIA